MNTDDEDDYDRHDEGKSGAYLLLVGIFYVIMSFFYLAMSGELHAFVLQETDDPDDIAKNKVMFVLSLMSI